MSLNEGPSAPRGVPGTLEGTAAEPAPYSAIPGPRGLELLRLTQRFLSHPHEAMLDVAVRYGPIVLLPFPLDHIVVLAEPRYIEYVFHQGHHRYDKQSPRWKTLRRIWGDGLLTADGEVWRRQRQRMQPAFHQDQLPQFADVIVAEAQKIGAEWAESARSGQARDVFVDMLRCAVRALSKAMFGSDVDGRTDLIIRAVGDINAYINPMALGNLLPLPDAVRRRVTPGFREYERAMDDLRQLFAAIIHARLATGDGRKDLLGMIMAGTDDEVSETMTERQLHDEMMTLLMAGHEPVGIATAWSWYWISQHPEVERTLHAELDAVLGGRAPTLEDVPRLEYTRMVFQEAMRLSPPIWGVERRAAEDDVIGGYRIPKGTCVALSQYVMHRHAAYWESPTAFDPERFAAGASAGRPQYVYFPFGGGPRRCIGMRFSMMQGPLMLAALAQSFSARPKPGHPVEPAPRLNLPPKYGLQMYVQRRQRVEAPSAAARA